MNNSVTAEPTPAQVYDKSTHRIGRAWMGFMLFVIIAVPFSICLIFHTMPNLSAAFWAAFIPMLLTYIPSSLVEVAVYSPMLGTGGTYLAFVTGNLSNLKIPCAMNSCEMAGAKIGTKESEIVSTISVATSAIVTTLVIAVGVLLIIPLTPLLKSPVLLPAFKCVIPAVFGALGFQYAKNYPKVAIVPMVLSITLFLIVPSMTRSVPMLVLVIALVSMAVALLLFKKGRV
jgi:hypothetical protein